MKKRLLLICFSLFTSWFAHSASVGGYIFEHYDFGGDQRDFYPGANGMVALHRGNIKVRLTNVYSQYRYEAYTGSDGYYWFRNIPNGTYELTLPNARKIGNDRDGELYSERGDCYECLPVQVWPHFSTEYKRTVVVNYSNISNANLGINYSAVLNHHDSGVGSLRQFLINSRFLVSGRSSTNLVKRNLKQQWHEAGFDNAIFVNAIRDIVVQSPLEIIDTEYTKVNAQVRLGADRPLSLRNGRTNPVNGDYGLKITNSNHIKLTGTNWNYFDDAIYINNSDSIELSENSFNFTRDSGVIVYDGNDNKILRNVFNDTVNKESVNEQAAALYLTNSYRNEIKGNAFYHSGDDHRADDGYQWHVSAIRVLYGNENKISENSFSDTRGMAIDLRYNDHIGKLNINDGGYEWSASVSNYAIDYPTLISVNNDGTASGNVLLNNINDHYARCNQSYSDIQVELYVASGQALESTIEGERFIGRCSLNNSGLFSGCSLLTDRFSVGDPITAITIDKCGNTSEMGQVINASSNVNDYGDAPNQDLLTGWGNARFKVTKADDGARHGVVSNMCLRPFGTNSCTFHVDAEQDGTPSRYATSDTTDDGVWVNPYNDEINRSSMPTFITGYLDINGREQSVENQILVNASQAGYVSVWLDKNQDGRWHDFERNKQVISEKIVDRKAVVAGSNLLSGINLSAYDVHGESWLRVRFSSSPTAIAQSYGAAPDGEVEDYRVWIAAPSLQTAGCEAGLQNGSFEHYYTERDHNNWDTPESSVAGWSIQQLNPALNPHNPPYDQRRNNIEFNRYSYYVNQPSSDGSSNVAELNVYHPTMLYQDIVTQPGDSIRWSFDYSNRTVPNSRNDDQISLMFGSPNSQLVESQVINGQDGWVSHDGVYTVPAGQYVTRIAFRANLPASASSGNILDNAKFGCNVGYDYGDLPSEYTKQADTHFRVNPNLYIGSEEADTETSSQTSELAKGDDQTDFNDEKTFESPVFITKQNSFSINDIEVLNRTGQDAYLNAWLDINRDGEMSSDEKAAQVVVRSSASPQQLRLEWSNIRNSRWTTENQSYLRLTLNQNGDGEVEDHLVYLINDDLMPEPGRCDGFIQVKAPDTNGQTQYQYSKWVANGGQLSIEDINPALSTNEIKVVGLSQKDGLTYGVGSDDDFGCRSFNGSSCEVHLFVADQSRSPAAEFSHLAPLRAAHDNVYVRDKNGNRFSFSNNEVLDIRKYSDNYNRRLARANSGDVSLDGRYMVIGRGSWRTLLRVDLATGAFDSIQLQLPQGQNAPWSADFAFNPNQPNSPYVYGLARNLKTLYRIAIVDVSANELAGSFTALPLKLKLNSDSQVSNPDWPIADSRGRLGSGGVGVNKGGILFAMTNGGHHDLDQDGRLETSERSRETTALYSIDIAKQEIRFELKGVDRSTLSNDAGGCAIHADYGDVPELLESSNPARHLGSNTNLKLGDYWSADLGPGHDGDANSDLSDDGVDFVDATTATVVNIAAEPLIPLKHYNLRLDKRGGGVASAWVNWGKDYVWHPININSGLTVPFDAGVRGYLRVRYSSSPLSSPFGEAPDGEVEDFSFEIGNPVKGIKVSAPSSPLTCEVAAYSVSLDVEGSQLSEDVDVEISFDNPPVGCWFDTSPFGRDQTGGKALCSSGKRTVTFAKDGGLTKSIYVATDSELKAVTLKAEATNIGADSDSANFSKEGFVIVESESGATYKAGEEFSIRLERKVALEDVASCSVDTDYQGDKSFTFRFDKGLEQHLGKLFMQGSSLISSGSIRTVSFSNGVSEALPISYSESGTLQLFADYLPTEGTKKSADASYIVHPYALTVKRNYKLNDASVESRSIGSPFVSAATPFVIDVAAVAKDGQVTRNFNGQLISDPSNSRGDDSGFSRKIVQPASKVGDATQLIETAGVNRVFSQGLLSNRFEYRNVGSISTRWRVDSYKGINGLKTFLDTDMVYSGIDNYRQVGYFYPDYFALTRHYLAPMQHASEPWTYFGKLDVEVSATLVAKSAGGDTLSFYDNIVMASGELPALATTTIDYQTASLPSCSQQLLHDSHGNSIDFKQSWSAGSWQLDGGTYAFYRNGNCRTQLNDVGVQMNVSAIAPSLTVPIYEVGTTGDLSGSAIDLGEPIDVRFGRLVMDNTSGPIEENLPMALRVEYWNGSSFAVNDWDSDSSLSASGIGSLPQVNTIVTQPAKPGEPLPVISNGSLTLDQDTDEGRARTHIQGSQAGYATIPFSFANDAEKWLGYCWQIDNDSATSIPDNCNTQSSFWQPPQALATFGVSAGSNNVIYFMERYQ